MFAVQMKEMVDNFIQNMNTIKATMALKHEKERKHFVKTYSKHPKRKYEDHGLVATPDEEELNFTSKSENHEADC